MESFSTTQLGFQRTIGVKDTYIPRTVLECLCKCAAKTHKSDDLNGAFVLTLGVEEPTLEGVAAIQVEVDDNALTKAIEAVKVTVRTSSRLWVDSKKAQENKEVDSVVG